MPQKICAVSRLYSGIEPGPEGPTASGKRFILFQLDPPSLNYCIETVTRFATSNKCVASSNKCLTSSNNVCQQNQIKISKEGYQEITVLKLALHGVDMFTGYKDPLLSGLQTLCYRRCLAKDIHIRCPQYVSSQTNSLIFLVGSFGQAVLEASSHSITVHLQVWWVVCNFSICRKPRNQKVLNALIIDPTLFAHYICVLCILWPHVSL